MYDVMAFIGVWIIYCTIQKATFNADAHAQPISSL